jgi:hypothetical protein
LVLDLGKSYTPSSLANIAESDGVRKTFNRCEESKIIFNQLPDIPESPALLYYDFGNFANRVRSRIVTNLNEPEIISLARNYIPILRNHFKDEKERKVNFCYMLNSLETELIFHKEYTLTGMGNDVISLTNNIENPAKSVRSNIIGMMIDPVTPKEVPIVIVEIKNEEGCTKSEPLVEAMGYYNCFARAAIIANSDIPLLWPSLIILHVGHSIRVYGAVTFVRATNTQTNVPYYLCEHLYSLQLNGHDEKVTVEMCKFLLVLRDQVKSLLEFRSNVGQDPACAGIPFPIHMDRNFLTHTGLVEVVPNTRVYINGTFVWKFTTRYSEEAHNCAHQLNIAPKLCFAETYGEWSLIRMQKISGVVVNRQTLCDNSRLWQDFKENVALFHQAGFVHGDMRQQNIMFGCLPESSEKGFFIMDFDWAGVKNQVYYPILINDSIKWPQGVNPLGMILEDHDLAWLQTIEQMAI